MCSTCSKRYVLAVSALELMSKGRGHLQHTTYADTSFFVWGGCGCQYYFCDARRLPIVWAIYHRQLRTFVCTILQNAFLDTTKFFNSKYLNFVCSIRWPIFKRIRIFRASDALTLRAYYVLAQCRLQNGMLRGIFRASLIRKKNLQKYVRAYIRIREKGR